MPRWYGNSIKKEAKIKDAGLSRLKLRNEMVLFESHAFSYAMEMSKLNKKGSAWCNQLR